MCYRLWHALSLAVFLSGPASAEFRYPEKVEVTHGEKKGFEYVVSVQDLTASLFAGGSNPRRFVVTQVENGFQVRIMLPDARLSAELRLKAKKKRGGSLFDVMGMSKIKRRYAVAIEGVQGDLFLGRDPQSGAPNLADLRLSDLKFDRMKIKLVKENDGALSALFNQLTGGSVDDQIRSAIAKEIRKGGPLGRTIPVARVLGDAANFLAARGGAAITRRDDSLGVNLRVEAAGKIAVEADGAGVRVRVPVAIHVATEAASPVQISTEGAGGLLEARLKTIFRAESGELAFDLEGTSFSDLRGTVRLGTESYPLAGSAPVLEMINEAVAAKARTIFPKSLECVALLTEP